MSFNPRSGRKLPISILHSANVYPSISLAVLDWRAIPPPPQFSHVTVKAASINLYTGSQHLMNFFYQFNFINFTLSNNYTQSLFEACNVTWLESNRLLFFLLDFLHLIVRTGNCENLILKGEVPIMSRYSRQKYPIFFV